MRPPTLSLTRRERALMRMMSMGSGGSTGAAAGRGLSLGVLKFTLSVMFAVNVLLSDWGAGSPQSEVGVVCVTAWNL